MTLLGHPAAVALTQAQQEMQTAQRARTIGGMEGEDTLQFVVEKDGAEVGLQLFGNDLGDDFKGLIEISCRIADTVDALDGMETILQVAPQLLTLRDELVHNGLVTTCEGKHAE